MRILIAAMLAAVGTTEVLAADDPGEFIVRAQDLQNVRKAGVTALWTRREGSYTLQLVFPVALSPGVVGVRIKSPAASQAGDRLGMWASELPPLQVWLLRADGSGILPLTRNGPLPEVCRLRCQAQEILFRFSVPDGSRATAVAIQLGDQYFIEKLDSLEPVTR